MDKDHEAEATAVERPPAAVKVARRGTMAPGGGGQRRSIVGGLLGRAALASLGNLASRRSKAQEVRLENTYRMLPRPEDQRLRVSRLRPALEQSLAAVLVNYEYNGATAGRKACEAAQTIRSRAREVGFERYKLVVFVALTECQPGVSAALASRALWASGECGDNYAEAAFTGKGVRGHATLHAVYYE